MSLILTSSDKIAQVQAMLDAVTSERDKFAAYAGRLADLLRQYFQRFEDFEDAHSSEEWWQSEELTALNEKAKAALAQAPEGANSPTVSAVGVGRDEPLHGTEPSSHQAMVGGSSPSAYHQSRAEPGESPARFGFRRPEDRARLRQFAAFVDDESAIPAMLDYMDELEAKLQSGPGGKLAHLFAMIESCHFECEAGPLKNCVHWTELREECRCWSRVASGGRLVQNAEAMAAYIAGEALEVMCPGYYNDEWRAWVPNTPTSKPIFDGPCLFRPVKRVASGGSHA